MTEPVVDFDYDYFISRCGVAGETADEVAGVLEQAGYRTKVQSYDFGRGSDFVGDIHDALMSARHMYVLHTSDYDRNYWTRKEFTNFLAAVGDSPGMRRICVLRCDDAAPRGILANVVYGDLVGVGDPEQRRAIILDVARGEALKARRQAAILGGAMPKKNEHFTGRKDALGRIKAVLAADESPTALKVVAIGGMGGMGKTALARAYVEECGAEYVGAWWVAADTRTALVAGLATLAAQLDPKYEGEPDLEKAARAALSRIERVPRPFLLVYDNVERWSAIDDLVPARGAHLLITSRRSDWAGRAQEIDIGVMSEDEAIDFLQARARRRDEAGARELARALGCLPLALDHAGAYVRLAMTTFGAYVRSIDKLLAKAPKDAPYPASVAATFSLAIDGAIAECPAAEALLAGLAFLAPDRIPLDLVADGVLDEDERAEAMIALADVSLLRPDPFEDDTPAVSVHRLVQAAARTRIAARGEGRTVLEACMRRLSTAFPDAAYDEAPIWPRCDALLPHALAIRGHAHADGFASEDLAFLYDRVGQFLHGRATFALAETLFREAIDIGGATLGNDHPHVAKIMTNLANVLCESGKAAEGEPLLREALRIEEKTVGRHDPSFGRTLTSLAAVLADTKRPAEAEQVLREAIAVGEASLGQDHPDVAGRYNNLASLLHADGRLEEAERLLREAIGHGERRLGRQHPTVAVRLNNLAMLLRDSGRLDEAEGLLRETIAAGKQALGADHPDVAVWLNNLANLLRDTRRYQEAEPLYRRALAVFERTHTDGHSFTARVRRNYAALLLGTGAEPEARRQAQMALAVHAQLLGPAHPWTMDSAATLAKGLDALGNGDEASAIRTAYLLPSGATE